MSLSSGPASWAPGGAADPLCPGYGLTLADAGWVMSACSSQERSGGGGWGSTSWTGHLARPKALARRKVTAQPAWLIRQEAECPLCHYRYPWPPAAPPAPTAYAAAATVTQTEPQINKHMPWLGCRRKVNFWLRLLIKVPCQIWTCGRNICAVFNRFVDLVQMRPITIPFWASAGARGQILIRCYLFSTAALTHPGANGVSSPFLWRRFTGREGGKVSWRETSPALLLNNASVLCEDAPESAGPH